MLKTRVARHHLDGSNPLVWLLCVVRFFFGNLGSGALGAIDSLGTPTVDEVLYLALELVLKLISMPYFFKFMLQFSVLLSIL